jgi:O-antigen ligase
MSVDTPAHTRHTVHVRSRHVRRSDPSRPKTLLGIHRRLLPAQWTSRRTLLTPFRSEPGTSEGLTPPGPEWGLAAAPAAVVAALAVADGGYFATAWGWTALALAAITTLGVLTVEASVTRLETAAGVAFAAFAAWALVSATWSIDAALSLREAERNLVYVAGFAAALAVTPRLTIAPLLGSLAAAIGLVALGGLVNHVLRDEADPAQGQLLFEPLGYANAVGIFVAIGILLAVGFAAQKDRHSRALGLGALPLLLPALALTSSRGAWAALALGLAATVALDPDRRRLIPTGRGAAIAVPAAAVATALLVAFIPDRSLTIVGDRPEQWRVAWRQFSEHPWRGSGAGTYREYWLQERPIRTHVLDAHSLYLETLGEVGAVGFVLLLVALAAPVAAAVAARSEPLVPAAAGAYVAFLAHAAIDWDWEMPAVTFAALLCGAALLRAPQWPTLRVDRTSASRAGLAFGAALAALAVLTILETSGPL